MSIEEELHTLTNAVLLLVDAVRAARHTVTPSQQAVPSSTPGDAPVKRTRKTKTPAEPAPAEDIVAEPAVHSPVPASGPMLSVPPPGAPTQQIALSEIKTLVSAVARKHGNTSAMEQAIRKYQDSEGQPVAAISRLKPDDYVAFKNDLENMLMEAP